MSNRVFNRNRLSEPIFGIRIIYPVIIYPALVAGIVWRIDINALHLPSEVWHERFQSFEIIAVNDNVIFESGLIGEALLLINLQLPVRDGEMIILNESLSGEFEICH